MELRHLRYFLAVAETCHFGRAADRLHLAQPALSQAIRQMETELGVTLLQRTTRRVSLTPAGLFLQSEAAQLLDRFDEAVHGVRSLSAGKAGLLRLGMTGTAAFSHLPRIARTLKRELPDVALAIRAEILTPEQCDALRAGTLDVGIVRPPVLGDDIATVPFLREELIVSLPAEHRLAGRRKVSLTELRDDPWVAYSSPRSVVNVAVARMCHEAGFAPRREHEAASTSVLLALVAAGLGVAMVPAGVRAIPLEGVAFCDVEPSGSLELVLAYRASGDNPIAEAVVPILAAASVASSGLSRE